MTDHLTDVPRDGEFIIDGLPFARCNRCDRIITLATGYEMLAGPHLTPCGRHCELSAHPEGADTCNGWCTRCRTIITGCNGDPSKPCGRPNCEECGVHIDASVVTGSEWMSGRGVCMNNRPTSRFAWTWGRVTCGGCLRHKPSSNATGETP